MPQLADACAAGDVAAVRRLLAVGNQCRATIEMKPMVTAAPVDAA